MISERRDCRGMKYAAVLHVVVYHHTWSGISSYIIHRHTKSSTETNSKKTFHNLHVMYDKLPNPQTLLHDASNMDIRTNICPLVAIIISHEHDYFQSSVPLWFHLMETQMQRHGNARVLPLQSHSVSRSEYFGNGRTWLQLS